MTKRRRRYNMPEVKMPRPKVSNLPPRPLDEALFPWAHLDRIQLLEIDGVFVDHFVAFGSPVSPLLHLVVSMTIGGYLVERPNLHWNMAIEFPPSGNPVVTHWSRETNRRLFGVVADYWNWSNRLTWWRLRRLESKVFRLLRSRNAWFLQIAERERAQQLDTEL
jgi:hypothetical protein